MSGSAADQRSDPVVRLSRVVQLLGPSTGGIRAHVATLAAGLDRVGVSSPVLGPVGVLGDLAPMAGVVRVPSGLDPVALLRARRQLACWRAGTQLVHAHGLKSAWTAFGGRPRRPVVLTVHNVVLDASAGRTAGIQRSLEREALRRADRVIALTTTMAHELREMTGDAEIRIALPASSPPLPGVSGAQVRAELGVGDRPLVVCVARLHPQKDLVTLLRAWALVHQQRGDAVLVVIGEGPQRAQLERLHRELALGDSARLLGHRAHAVNELAAADLAVMTSLWEGASLVLAETTQLGVPMVSTPVGLAPDLLDGEVGGLVVPCGAPDAVAVAVCRMLDDPAAALEMGRRGRARALELFNPERAIEAIMDVYREVL